MKTLLFWVDVTFKAIALIALYLIALYIHV